MSFIRVSSKKVAFSALYLVDELSFYAIDVIYWPAMNEGWLTFLVNPHLESLLHLNVAPESRIIIIPTEVLMNTVSVYATQHCDLKIYIFNANKPHG